MSIDAELYLLSGGLASGSMIAAWQAWRLKSIYRSRSSWVGAITFLLFGARQLFVLLRLRATIVDARAKGFMIERLSWEQWLVAILWSYAIIIGFIVWQHLQHRELKQLGI